MSPVAIEIGNRWSQPGTVVPVLEQRRPIGAEALKEFFASANAPPQATAEFITGPQIDRLAKLANLTLAHAFSHPGETNPDIAKACAAAGMRYLGVTHSPARSLTTTVDVADMLFPRLHVDNQDKVPRGERVQKSRRRLAINLGPGDRYLLFCRPDILVISDELYDGDQQRIPNTEDFREYARQNPGAISSFWTLLKEGDPYLVPSELWAHDGSSADIDQESRIAFWLCDG